MVVVPKQPDDAARLAERPTARASHATREPSERWRADDARESEERFRLIVESVKDYAIFRLDPRGFVVSWNVGAERIKGYRADEIVGQHFSRFYSEDEVRSGKCEMELACAARDGRFEDEGWRLRKDGSRFWANVIITALRDSDGELVGYAKVTRDLTERRAAEEERLRLGKLARARMDMLGDLSEALSSALSVAEVATIAIERARLLSSGDTCTLYLFDEERRTLELLAQHGCHPAIVERIRSITADSGNPSYAIGVGGSDGAWAETAAEYLAYFPALATLPTGGAHARAFWCVPLVAENRTMGMLATGFYGERAFAQDEREFIRTFARQCAQALARARRLEAERAAGALAERLRASLATTLRSIGDALIATDAAGKITLMNGVAESLTGWRESDARGRLLPEVFHIVNERTRAIVPNPVDKVLETGGIVGIANHTVLLARDGREIPIDDSGAPIRAEGGMIEGVVLVFRDVSERKRDELRRSFLTDATSVLAESLDCEVTVSRVAELAVPRLADWCAIDLVVEGQRLPRRLALVHAEPSKLELARLLFEKHPGRPDARAGLMHVLATGRPELYADMEEASLVERGFDVAQVQIVRTLGVTSAMLVPLCVRGRVIGVIGFACDQARRVYDQEALRFAEDLAQRCANAIENARAYAAEQQARRAADVANRAKDEFLAIVSHELRTPLNAIMGWAQMLTLREMDEARLKRAHETIERNAVAMAQLIEDLLDMSRVISGKLRIDVQRVELARVVEAATESIRPAVLAKNIQLAESVAEGLPEIMGDPTRLQQIVWNLLSNAVKFTGKDGRVEMVLRRVGSALEVGVSDSGQGIAPEFLPSVFEPFRQEDAGPSRHRGGLGLGLAITRQLVELHGGRIVAHSEGEGRGASFFVTLPIAAPISGEQLAERRDRRLRAHAPFDKPEHIRGLRVLVVDDEEDARTLVAMILEDCGCRVTTAESAAQALRAFEEVKPDVLLSDIGMPGESGYDLIRKIRARPVPEGGDVPAAALTAYVRPEDRRNMLNAGYSIHLAKPVEPAELVAVVATLSRFIRR